MRRLRRLVLIGAILAAGAGGLVYARLTTPYRGFAGEEVFVDLPQGTGVAEIARRLAAAGVVPDPYVFRLAVYRAGLARRLEAGEYRFAAPATPGEVAARLARGDVFTRTVVYREGLSIREMAPIFEKSGLGTAEEFRLAASDGSRIAALDPGAESLEGYLFPDTYPLPRRAGASGTVDAMLARFARAFDADLRAAAAAAGMSQREVVTLASLVELESAQADERPIISGVFHRRLKIGMPLQCDPTVIYALARAGRWDGNIHKPDLQIDSPYNTYRHAGLPPGPIASPGRASLQAAVHPADVPYLYFVSRGDGTHAFAATLAEHNRNVQLYQVRKVRQVR
jgi:UPF0755 protein